MEKVRIFVWEPTPKGCKVRPMYYTRFVHKGGYVRLYGSKWRIRKSAVMNDSFILAGMLE